MKKWKNWEIEIIKNQPYAKHCELLPDRSYNSINHKRHKLRLKSGNEWTQKEIEILKNNTFKNACKLLSHRSKSSIHHKRSRLQIPHENRWSKNEIELLKKTRDKSIFQIKKILKKRSLISIKHKLQKLEIKRDCDELSKRKTILKSGLSLEQIDNIVSNNKFNQIIAGCLLGDGSIAKGRFSYSSTSKQHTEYIFRSLKIFGFSNSIYLIKRNPDTIKINTLNIKAPEKIYSYQIGNKIIFYPLEKSWYPHGIKIIPENILLTKTSCLIWYLGDGSLSLNNNGQSLTISLCTNGFTIKDNMILKEKLEKEINSSCHIFKTGRIKTNNDEEYMLRLYGTSAYKFLKYIGPCVVEDYKHKWEIGKCRIFLKKCIDCGKKTEYVSNKYYDIKYRCKNCRKSWNKENIISSIHDRFIGNLPINSRAVYSDDLQLYQAAARYFEKWGNAVVASGLDYNDIKLTEKWTREKVLFEIQKCSKIKKTFYPKLRYAAEYYFGSFTKAKELAGVS